MLADGATDAEVKFVGFSLVFHNTELNPGAVIQKYFEKDVVERSFRTMKEDVQLYPIRLWLPNPQKDKCACQALLSVNVPVIAN
jgi:hypothetical protein